MAVTWENNILGFIPQKDWLSVDFQVERPGDPADQLFSDQKTDNLVAEWQSIAAEYQIPVMAQFHGFDVESQTTFRVPIDTHNIEKGLIKVKINQSERMRALLRSGVQGDDRLYEFVINDAVRLAEQIVTRTKVAKNELLATGQVTIKENNLDLTVDYGVPAAQKNLTLDFGAGATADIPDQLRQIVDAANEKGVILTGMYTGRDVIGKLRANEAIQRLVNGNSGVGSLLRRGDLDSYLSEEFGINRILENDLIYGASETIGADNRPQITTRRYYPKNTISFFATNPGGRLGVGLWGDAPELDVTQHLDASQSSTSPYVAITQWAEKDPSVLWTKATALFMPVLYNPDSLWIATVTETLGG